VSTNPRRGRSTSPIATANHRGHRKKTHRIARAACREPFRRHASSARSPYLRTSRSGRGPRRHRRGGRHPARTSHERGEHASTVDAGVARLRWFAKRRQPDRVRPLLRRTSTPGDRAGHRHRSRLILLDEPAAGTNPSEKLELAALIRRVRNERNVSVLLIEHDMKLVMSLAERITFSISVACSPRARRRIPRTRPS